jgi:DNA-binding NtrC family response regulator
MTTLVAVVDDDAATRRQIRHQIEEEGFDAIEYEPHRRGIDRIATECVDLVVTDLVMPECSGFELLREIRRRALDLPVVAYSGDIPSFVTAAERLGADATVSSHGPLGPRAVAETVRRVARPGR